MSQVTPRVAAVLVRCDLGPEYGVGHLMRCLALAEELAARGVGVVFSADVEAVPFAERQLRSRGFGWVAPAPTAATILAQAAEVGAGAVVIDSYHLPPELYAEVRAALPTLAVVDGDPVGKDADVILDQNIGAEEDSWPLPGGTVRLAGLGFALMRSDIRVARPTTVEDRPEATPPSVLAFFGGTDAFGAAPTITRALVATGLPFDLRVVGATAGLRADLASVPPAAGQRIVVIEPSSDLAAEVVAADLVVSATGSASWELLCLGAACAFVAVADNQVTGYERIDRLGVAGGLGLLDDVREDPATAVQVLAGLLGDPALRAGLRRRGHALVDGRGRERVVDAWARAWTRDVGSR